MEARAQPKLAPASVLVNQFVTGKNTSAVRAIITTTDVYKLFSPAHDNAISPYLANDVSKNIAGRIIVVKNTIIKVSHFNNLGILTIVFDVLFYCCMLFFTKSKFFI